MQYGICNLSIVPLRLEPRDASEMVSQVLYGDVFKVLESRKKWSKIRLSFDDYEGWVDNKQYLEIEKNAYVQLISNEPCYITNQVDCIEDNISKAMLSVPIGVNISALTFLNHQYDGVVNTVTPNKNQIIEIALKYLNAPYLWGGKTPFGIDCSGFTQMVYKQAGFKLLRDASQQATQGLPLSFIEESEPGDLAFFDNAEGKITHVGIIMEDNYIIHAHGKVRIDRLDHSGIYNVEKRQHTHKLRVIKKIIT